MKDTSIAFNPARGWRAAQRGVSMLFALCALAVLTMGAVALVRSVDTGMTVLGNLGFKKDALAAGSIGTEKAIAWLRANPTQLTGDVPTSGYYSQAYVLLDPTGSSAAANPANAVLADWEGVGNCKIPGNSSPVCLLTAVASEPNASNTVRFVITRLCKNTGPTQPGNSCVQGTPAGGVTQSSARGSVSYGDAHMQDGTADSTTYRILTRTKGARDSVAFTETLVHF